MTEHDVVHSTFTLTREYPASRERVFAAWADPAAKAHWFAGADAEHALDFRVGGCESVHRAADDDMPELRYETVYQDIVENERIVYTSSLYGAGHRATVSLTTVQLSAAGEGTRLELTEQGAFLDGRELPAWREQGTSSWLDTLGRDLSTSPGSGPTALTGPQPR